MLKEHPHHRSGQGVRCASRAGLTASHLPWCYLSAAKVSGLLLVLMLLSGCDFKVPGPDEAFGEQHFVSAVSLIELHKTRNGQYPVELSELEFLGNWDGIWLGAVRYERVEGGYNLFVERGWMGEPSLTFPERFKQGLGLKDSNVTWVVEAE